MNTEILKAALLGTDRHIPEISANAPEVYARIAALPTSKEDRFLKMAFASIMYEEAGTQPIVVETRLPECPTESRPVVNAALAAMVQSALTDRNDVIFQFLLFKIGLNGQVIQPHLVPMILNRAVESKKDRQKLLGICGVTGKWLCDLNPNWHSLQDSNPDNASVWETGDLESRKTFLAEIRKNDPAAAIALLGNTFAQENAGNRLVFVQMLQERLSIADEPFLQSLLTDKSQKVREATIDLLRKIPGSALHQTYMDWLRRMIQVREERHLLVTKKKVLTISGEVMPDDSLFKTGIEKVSKEKGVEDHVFITGQLLSFMDPALLANRLDSTDQELITLLLQHQSAAALLPFLTSAAVQFLNRAWALALLHRGDAKDIGLLNALPANERLPFYLQFLNGNAQNLFTYLLDDSYTALPMRLAEQLLDHLSKFPYHITQPVYQRLALHLPEGILPVLKRYAEDPRQDYQLRYFKNQASEMMRLLELRKNIA